MYCCHCGKKVDQQAVICPHCGCELKKRGNGLGIASMVLGIIGLCYALGAFFNITSLGSYLDYQTFAYQFGFAIGYVLVQSVLSIIALCLSLAERSRRKTGFNTAGFWLALLALFCVVIQFISVITY